jgi:acetyl esterase/lipase
MRPVLCALLRSGKNKQKITAKHIANSFIETPFGPVCLCLAGSSIPTQRNRPDKGLTVGTCIKRYELIRDIIAEAAVARRQFFVRRVVPEKSIGLSLSAMSDEKAGASSEILVRSSWTPRQLMGLATLVTVLVFVNIVGALFPTIPGVGVLGTLLESFVSLHIVIAGVFGILLALAARKAGGSRLAEHLAEIAMIATAASTVPLATIAGTARGYDTPISWTDHLRIMGRAPAVPEHPNQTVAFATIEGKTLYVDIYLPAHPPTGLSAPVLMMHGGGYIHGHRSMLNRWDRWLAERGYTVFDIDYRLAPPPTWNQAAQDAACAMAWIAANAAAYDVDPKRMLVAGQSAGAGLALQVAYGLGDGTVTSSCGGLAPQPAAVFALYPPDDFALGWNINARLGPSEARIFLRDYIGGSPQDFPDRYRAVSAIDHVRAGLPPMLIVSGDHDHLVPYQGHLELVEKLNRVRVHNTLITIPYGEHAFDLAWGSLGAQLTRHALEHFLQQYLPESTPQ